jgi:hypothetical protein
MVVGGEYCDVLFTLIFMFSWEKTSVRDSLSFSISLLLCFSIYLCFSYISQVMRIFKIFHCFIYLYAQRTNSLLEF